MLFAFSLILLFTLLVGMIFARFKLPLLPAYILSGFILGIIFRYGIHDNQLFSTIASTGVIFLLFSLGLEFPLKKIFNTKSPAFSFTLLQIFFTSICFFVIFCFLKIPASLSVVISILFSFSSTVVVVKSLSAKGTLHTMGGELTTTTLILQDLIILPLSLFLPLIFEFKAFNFPFLINIFLALVKSIGIFVLIILFAKKVIPIILQKVARYLYNDLMILSIISLSLFFAAVAERLGFTLAIGAFAAGMIIATTSSRHEVFSEIRPLRDIFSIIFFIFLGFSLDGVFLYRHLLLIVGLAVIIIIVKIVATYLILVLRRVHQKNALEIAVYLVPVSEFAFILFSMYFSEGLIKKEDFQLVAGIVLLTIIISPFLIVQCEKLVKRIHFLGKADRLRFVLGGDDKFVRHVVLCGYGRIGKQIIKQLIASNIPFVVIDNNRDDMETLKGQGYNAVYGDATEIEILKFAGAPQAKVVVVALPDRFSQEIIIAHVRRLNPQVAVYCRVHEEAAKKYLYAAGAQFVLYPEFEGAAVMSRRILKLFGV